MEFVSLMAPNATPWCRELVGYLSQRSEVVIDFTDAVDWQERERRLYRGEAQLGIVCGLQYVYAVERGEKPGIDLLAAPVMSGHRYANTPVYFSDVVVRTDSAARSLKDLRGARWAYNEPTSQSGYNITRYTLATRGELTGFFGEAIASGAHEQSLELLLRGEIDATAIDSTVLDQELRCRPDLAARIRVIEALGPSPIPPLVVSRSVPDPLRIRWQAIVLGMHTDPAGQGVLASGAVSRFSRVNDADYDAIREMDRVARDCRL